MEFSEKLQELRRSKGLTQEELADDLFVSRAAVTKWESGRGYPNIESLKDISKYFAISMDDLLSSEKLILIAENENKTNIKRLYDKLLSFVDLLYLLLIALPIYPKTIGDYVYSVNLWNYGETSKLNLTIYWVLFLCLVLLGVVKLVVKCSDTKAKSALDIISFALGVTTVFYLSLAREPYAAAICVMILFVKALLQFKMVKLIPHH